MKALIIDDDFHLLTIVADRLKVENYEVLKASDGIDGLRLAADFNPDIILLDIMMPNVDGHSILHVIKNSENLKHIHVFMMTARRERAEVTKAISAGAAGYFIKPIDFRAMFKKIASVVGPALPPPDDEPEEKDPKKKTKLDKLAGKLANFSVEIDSVAASAGVDVPRIAKVDINNFQIKVEEQDDIAIFKLEGTITNKNKTDIEVQIKVVKAGNIKNVIVDSSGLYNIEIGEAMLIADSLSLIKAAGLSAGIVEPDEGRRKFYRQCNIHIEHSIFEKTQTAIDTFSKKK